MSQPAPPGPSTPDEWIEAFVASMAAARDVADARQRAARLLHAFQQTVMAAAAGQVSREGRVRSHSLGAGVDS